MSCTSEENIPLAISDRIFFNKELLKKLFGDKSSKDRKEYQPSIDTSTAFDEGMMKLSDDELRSKTDVFRKIIADSIAGLEK